MWDLRSLAGIEPAPPALGTGHLNHWTAREVPGFCILEISIWPLGIASRSVQVKGQTPLAPTQPLGHHPGTRDNFLFCCPTCFQSSQASFFPGLFSWKYIAPLGITCRLKKGLRQAFLGDHEGSFTVQMVQKNREDWECLAQCLSMQWIPCKRYFWCRPLVPYYIFSTSRERKNKHENTSFCGGGSGGAILIWGVENGVFFSVTWLLSWPNSKCSIFKPITFLPHWINYSSPPP